MLVSQRLVLQDACAVRACFRATDGSEAEERSTSLWVAGLSYLRSFSVRRTDATRRPVQPDDSFVPCTDDDKTTADSNIHTRQVLKGTWRTTPSTDRDYYL